MVVLSTLVFASAAFAFDNQMASMATVLSKLAAAPEDETIAEYQQPLTTCPGAAEAFANIHTSAQMVVTFTNSCSEVAAEIQARGQMEDGWTDPHNGGKYAVVAATSSMITTTRTTGNGEYTDKQTFALSATGLGGCAMNACSASQGTSADDGGTNLCDMFDLFCNSSEKNPDNGVACKPINTDLSYKIDSEQCGRYVFNQIYATHTCQNALTTCLKVQSQKHAEALRSAGKPPAQEVQVVLGEYQNCPAAAHAAFNIHTMSQMQVDFTNSCEEVAGEIEARASSAKMNGGWEDPHNGGTYSLLTDTTATNIETSRTTRGGKYTDKQSFSLQAKGTGCTAYICSSSQGTSADDGGTNICDMYNLFCNSSETNPKTGISCKPIKTNLQYTIVSRECGRYVGQMYFATQCVQANPTCLVNTQYSLAAPLRFD